MLWEGGWEWARLTKSKCISIEITCLLLLLLLHSYSLYIYTPPPPFLGYARTLSPPLAPPPPENLHSVRGCPKKVEKTSSENTTFAKSEHPYRTCGSPGGFFFIFDFPIFDQKPIIPFEAVPKKSKKRQAETRFSKKCIWLRAVPKKSKKRQAKTLLFKIWSTPIALPASRSDLLLSLVF